MFNAKLEYALKIWFGLLHTATVKNYSTDIFFDLGLVFGKKYSSEWKKTDPKCQLLILARRVEPLQVLIPFLFMAFPANAL